MTRQVLGRLAPVVVLFLVWEGVAQALGNRLVPPASTVLLALMAEARSGQLARNLGVTLGRVAAAFSIAMVLGTVLGVLMGRYHRIDRALDSVLTVLLNLPALVGIVLNWIVFGIGLAITVVAIVRWARETREDIADLPLEHQ